MTLLTVPDVAAILRVSPATVRALLAALDGHRLRDMVLVMAATGLRVSEAMGLRWTDVDGLSEVRGNALAAATVDARSGADQVPATVLGMRVGQRVEATLTVRYQLARVDGEPVLTEPKSARSRRTILLPPLAAAALRRHSALQAAERLAAGTKWRDATGLVFTAKDGSPLSESTVQWVMAEACKRAGIRHLSPHSLRRWTATAIVASGEVKAAQAVLGHVSASLTVDTYSSPTDAGLRRAADAVEEALE